MNNSQITLAGVTVVRDAKVFGDDKPVAVFTVAVNTFGEKAKEKYPSYFVEVRAGGYAAKQAAELKKGDRVTVVGAFGEYEYKAKDGTTVKQKCIPFPTLVVCSPKPKAADYPIEHVDGPAEDAADPFGF